jgi:actin-related protein
VIDVGSGNVKTGFAGNDVPSVLFPTVIGKLQVNFAAQMNPDAIPSRPIERGVVTGRSKFYSIVNDVYQSLDLQSENNNVLIARPSGVEPKQLEAITEHFIKTLHAPSISFISSATLSLLSTGRVTGIVAECGYGVINVDPERHLIPRDWRTSI